MPAPVSIPLWIAQGQDFARVLNWKTGDPAFPKAVNLTGWSALLEGRPQPFATPQYTIGTTPTAQGTIALGGPAGTIALASTFAETALLTPGALLYALTMIDPFGRRRVFCGGPLVILAPPLT